MRTVALLLTPLRSVVGMGRGTYRTVVALPRVVEAVLVLPTLSQQLENVAVATATLPEMLAEIERVRADTNALPRVDETLERMARILESVEENTLAVEQLAEVAVPLQSAATRLGRFADRLPQRRNGPSDPQMRRSDSPSEPPRPL